jgi:hypothetical protein
VLPQLNCHTTHKRNHPALLNTTQGAKKRVKILFVFIKGSTTFSNISFEVLDDDHIGQNI